MKLLNIISQDKFLSEINKAYCHFEFDTFSYKFGQFLYGVAYLYGVANEMKTTEKS